MRRTDKERRMFLRAENDTPEVRERIAALDARVVALRGSSGPVPTPETARARLDLAGILCWRGHYRETHELLEPLTSEQYDPQIVFEARQLIGNNYYRHDQYDLASKQYHENLDRARAANEEYWSLEAESGIAWVLIDVGHYTSGEFPVAGEIFERHAPIYRRQGNLAGESMAIYGLSRAVAGAGDYGRAIQLATQCVEMLRGSEAEFLVQLPLLQLANVHRDRGNFEEARPLYDEAILAADQSQDPYLQVLTMMSYGLLLRYTNDLDGAMAAWRSVLPSIKELSFPRLGHELCSRLALAAAERGDFEEAYRQQLESKEYGNRVGVMSSILHNQQMLLRDQIHQTKQLEDTLDDLRAGVEASVDGIFVLEKPETGIDRDDFVIRFANEAASRILGKKAVTVEHVLLGSVWGAEWSEPVVQPSLEVFSTGVPRTLDSIQLEFKKGEPRWYSVKIAKIPKGVVWTVSDVTAREEMQRQIVAQRDRLSEANERLTALDREKSEMLGIAAHDLRSPIGNIRSICELISSDDPLTVDLIRTIEEISDSMLSLIGNLLDVERIERGEIELRLTVQEIGPLLTGLVEHFKPEANQKEIEIRAELSETPLFIRADGSAVQRVVQNLLSNGVKFSPRGSRVFVRAFPSGSKVRIEVADEGRGITEADRKKLFSKFARLSARPTAGESSTGLGLSIVKQLVEAMGGRVGCESEPGNGATFWVEFDLVSSVASTDSAAA